MGRQVDGRLKSFGSLGGKTNLIAPLNADVHNSSSHITAAPLFPNSKTFTFGWHARGSQIIVRAWLICLGLGAMLVGIMHVARFFAQVAPGAARHITGYHRWNCIH